MMTMILKNIETESVLSYIDDLMICSKTINEHIFKLEKIFNVSGLKSGRSQMVLRKNF
jgi:hypothetical protein